MTEKIAGTIAADGRIEMRAVGQITGTFFVPSYQRGYRWGKHEVEALLNDLWAFCQQPGALVYCLQPVVLKYAGDRGFELIDGQQRLTTLFILAQYMASRGVGAKPRYAISYETRRASAGFLDRIARCAALVRDLVASGL
jgi:hypothetical protein